MWELRRVYEVEALLILATLVEAQISRIFLEAKETELGRFRKVELQHVIRRSRYLIELICAGVYLWRTRHLTVCVCILTLHVPVSILHGFCINFRISF